MKNKIIIIVLIVLGVGLAVSVGIYFIKQNDSPTDSFENVAQQDQGGVPANLNSKMQEETMGDVGTNNQAKAVQFSNKLVTDDFSLDIPAGWIKTEPPIGASVMAVNMNEDINDPAAKKINFKSYLAVSYDTFQGKTMNEYIQTVKDSILQTIPNVIFSNEQDILVNDRPAHAIEAELVQQGVGFKILMAVIAGEGEDIWVISFNTTKSSWDGYKEMFYGIVNSFTLKK